MDHVMHAFDWLEEEAPTIGSMCALIGDDRFLKRLSLAKVRQSVSAADATEFNSKTPWRDVMDELSTRSLFDGGSRLVFVLDADVFVKDNRAQLESYVNDPAPGGCLVLDLNALASNTRLYKLLSQSGSIIECRAPLKKRGKGASLDEQRLREWLRQWSESTHGIKLQRGADEELMQLVGPELGLLDQELAKLALFCDTDRTVSIELVRKIVGGWRAKTTWELLDAILDGHAAEAMVQLERLLQAGEAPQAIAGALLWSLRRFADAAQLVVEAEHVQRRVTLTMVLEQAGVKKWPTGALQRAERQLRQLGRHRASVLYRRLLELDLSMKRTHSTPARARWALEQFLLSLSKQGHVA